MPPPRGVAHRATCLAPRLDAVAAECAKDSIGPEEKDDKDDDEGDDCVQEGAVADRDAAVRVEVDRELREIDPAERERLSRRAIEHAAQFGWERTTDRLLDVYLQACRERTPSPIGEAAALYGVPAAVVP